jgi:hypothetical protein
VNVGESGDFVKGKRRKSGILEYWSIGMMGYAFSSIIYHPSSIPFFHHSIFTRREAAKSPSYPWKP